MNTEQLCNHIIHLIHMPIHVYNEEGIQTAVYVDNGEQQDVIECDSGLLELLLEKGCDDYPVLSGNWPDYLRNHKRRRPDLCGRPMLPESQ